MRPSRKKQKKAALVLGIGNILLKDEGFGVRTTEYFKAHFSFGPDVTCMDGGTSGLGLLSYIQEYSHIVIVDAVAAKGQPGKILRVYGQEIQKWPSLKSSSAHQIGVRDLLTLAHFQGFDPEVAIIGVIPKDISAGLELTPTIRKAVPLAADAVMDELNRFGFKAGKKD